MIEPTEDVERVTCDPPMMIESVKLTECVGRNSRYSPIVQSHSLWRELTVIHHRHRRGWLYAECLYIKENYDGIWVPEMRWSHDVAKFGQTFLFRSGKFEIASQYQMSMTDHYEGARVSVFKVSEFIYHGD